MKQSSTHLACFPISQPSNTEPILIDMEMKEVIEMHKFSSNIFVVGVSHKNTVVTKIVDVVSAEIIDANELEGVDDTSAIKTAFSKTKFVICVGSGAKLQVYVYTRGTW
jgi:hypothetical protein